VVEGVQGLRELAVFGAGSEFLRRLMRKTRLVHAIQMRYGMRAGLEQAAIDVLLALAVLATVATGLVLVAKGALGFAPTLWPRAQAGPRRLRPRIAARRDRGARRRLGGGQNDLRQSADAALGPATGPHQHFRLRDPRLALDALRRKVTLVPQDVHLFSGTVADNIRLGRPEAGDAEVELAARLAQAHEFILSLPDGYATQCGERGTRLSGGQRQRIAIARAFLRDAPILVMDEAVSNLDSDSEAALHVAMETVRRGRNRPHHRPPALDHMPGRPDRRARWRPRHRGRHARHAARRGRRLSAAASRARAR
jgi:ATP-binding cassette, subfamily C, bacterial CydC